MIYPIRYYGDPLLRKRASPVRKFDAELARLAADMIETMYAADGIGLAAPQIGVQLRLFVALEAAARDDDDVEVAGQLSASAGHEDQAGADGPPATEREPHTRAEKREAWGVINEHVIVNPVIVESSGRQYGRDGCLSLPGLVVDDVPRALDVVLDYQDLSGGRRRLSAHGYFAHVLQHEFDHLEGVLFFDHLPPARRESFLEENRAQLAQWQREARSRLKGVADHQPRTRAG